MTVTHDRSVMASRSSLAAADVLVDDAPMLANDAAATSRHVWPTSGQYGPGLGNWRGVVVSRVSELSHRPVGWDGYGGDRLKIAAVKTMFTALEQLDQFIGRPPAVSLTADGGLLCSWSGSDYSLDLESDGNGHLSAYFVEHATGTEHDVEATDGAEFDKWVWQATRNF